MKTAMMTAFALALVGLVITVEPASAYCGYCTPSCTAGNYSECRNLCWVRAEGGVGTQAQTCWCEQRPSSCAYVLKDVGPDGAVYAHDGLNGREILQDGKRLLVACDGTILARIYSDETLVAAEAPTFEIEI